MSNEQKERAEYIPGLLTATGWDFADSLAVQFYNAILLRDFGPWKKGQAVECMSFDYTYFSAVEYNMANGLPARTCEFTLQAIAWEVSE